MQRGNLVIYDETGKIFSQTGEAEGDILPHDYPVGIPYMEIPYGTASKKRLVSIDISVTPHQPIFGDILYQPSLEERLLKTEADNEMLKLMVAELGLMVGGGL